MWKLKQARINQYLKLSKKQESKSFLYKMKSLGQFYYLKFKSFNNTQ